MSGGAHGVQRDARGNLVIGSDAPTLAAQNARYGVAESSATSLAGPTHLGDVQLDAKVPHGAVVEFELRGLRDGRWTEWREPAALDALDGATAFEVRTTLLASPTGETPVVRGVQLRAERASVRAAQLTAPLSAPPGPPTVKLWATRIGLVGRSTANGHVIVEKDRFVALPSKRALNRNGARDYQVQITYRGRTTVAPVWDVGPWNIKDDYWNEDRETFDELPRWLSQAEAAFFHGHNGGRDGSGRYVTYPTSIDLADGTFIDDLGMGDSDWVEVTFLWLSGPSPAPRPTPRVTPRTAPTTAGPTAPSGVSGATGASGLAAAPTVPSAPSPAPAPGVLRAAAYNAPVAAPRVSLPLVTRDPNGWTTSWTIQNASNLPAEGLVELYDAGGGRATVVPFELRPFAAVTVSAADVPDLPDGFVGSAVITANRPVAAVVMADRSGADRYAYEAMTGGATTLFAPVVLKDREGWVTGIQVQNLGGLPTTVQVIYASGPAGRWFDTADLAPFGSATFYQPAHPALPPGFAGSAVITSLNAQPLGAVVTQVRVDGSAMAYVAAGSGAERLEAPVLFRHYNGWESAVQLFNLGSSPTAAAIAYRGAPQPVWDNALVPASGATVLPQGSLGMLPDGYVGSATVQAPPGSRLTGVVSEVRAGSMAAMNYSAGASPAPVLAVPLVVKSADDWTSGVEVQNPNGTAVLVALTLYDASGAPVQRVQEMIQPGATCNFYLAALDGVPDGFEGSALVQSISGQPLFGVVNSVHR